MLALITPDNTVAIKRGDRLWGAFLLTLQDGTPIDLTGYDFSFSVAAAYGAPHWFLLTTTPPRGLSVPDPSTGQVVYDISPTQTAACVAGPCVFDFKLLAGTGDVETILSGPGTTVDEVL